MLRKSNLFSGMTQPSGIGTLGGIKQTYDGRAGAVPGFSNLENGGKPYGDLGALHDLVGSIFTAQTKRRVPQSTTVGTTNAQSSTPKPGGVPLLTMNRRPTR